MRDRYNVLFLCTGNSARSIMAEAILNFKAQGRIAGYSAGSHPAGTVRPEALRQMRGAGIPIDGLRSKSWDEFAREDAPQMDFVFTVCDNAARETCPVWPGRPATAHWGLADPAAARGTDEEVGRAFAEAFKTLEHRIDLLLELKLESMESSELKARLEEIGGG